MINKKKNGLKQQLKLSEGNNFYSLKLVYTTDKSINPYTTTQSSFV